MSFSFIGGGNWRKPLTSRKSLTKFIKKPPFPTQKYNSTEKSKA
jgi:hypothetical protein